MSVYCVGLLWLKVITGVPGSKISGTTFARSVGWLDQRRIKLPIRRIGEKHMHECGRRS
jgi:hypothetical protein